MILCIPFFQTKELKKILEEQRSRKEKLLTFEENYTKILGKIRNLKTFLIKKRIEEIHIIFNSHDPINFMYESYKILYEASSQEDKDTMYLKRKNELEDELVFLTNNIFTLEKIKFWQVPETLYY